MLKLVYLDKSMKNKHKIPIWNWENIILKKQIESGPEFGIFFNVVSCTFLIFLKVACGPWDIYP